MKKTVIIGILVLMCCLSGCKVNFYQDSGGDYLYYKFRDSMNNLAICITGLTEQGKQKETLVIPTVIAGHPVKGFGFEFGIRIEGILESENVKTVYMSNQIERFIYEGAFSGLVNLETIYCSLKRDQNISMSNRNYCKNIVTSKYDYDNYIDKNVDQSIYSEYKIANVVYYENYGDNQPFFVDDCNGTTVNVIPPDPIREDYKFVGWYKEAECINEWNFANDIVPKKEYDENGQLIFKETQIFAKWKKTGWF